MPLKYVKASLPHLNFLTCFLLVLVIMGMSAAGAFMIRMKKGPIDMNFAKERLETALSDSDKGYKVEIGNAILTWATVKDSILIELSGVKIIQEDMTGLSVDHVSLGLSGLHLLRGKLRPSVLIIDNPTFQLTHQDGSLNLFWQERGEAVKEAKEEKSQTPKQIRRSLGGFLEKITNPAQNDINALSALKQIELKKAVITGLDKTDGTPHHLAMVDLALKKNSVGLQGNLSATLIGDEGRMSGFKSDIVYRQDQKDMTFTSKINNINLSRFANIFPEQSMLKNLDMDFNGSVKAAFDNKLKLQLADLQVSVPEGNIIIPGVYDTAVPLKNISLSAYLNRPNKKLEVKNLSAVMADIAIQGKALGTIENDKIYLPLDINIPEVAVEDLKKILPESEKDTSFGEWLTSKLKEGIIKNAQFTADLNMVRRSDIKTREIDFNNARMAFDFENLTIKYSDTLMPVKNSSGKGVYENDSLIIEGDNGKIGDIEGSNVKVKMTDLSVQGGGKADINLNGNGPLRTALKYLSAEPIEVHKKLGFDIEGVKGNVNFNLQLNFPTVKGLPKEQVVMVMKGKVTDLTLPKVVQGLSLTGGPYDLQYENGAVSLKGKGQLDGRAAEVDWFQYFDTTGKDFESKITAKVISDVALRKAFGIGLEDYISGPLPVDVTYIDKGSSATIDVKGDLTPTTLQIKPFKYNKPSGVKGNLSLNAFMKNNELKEVDNLKLTTKDFSIVDGRIMFRKYKAGNTDISRGALPKITLGKTQVGVDFEVSNDNVLKATAKGDVVDIAPFINTDKKPENWSKPKKNSERPMKISVTAGKLLAHNGEALGSSKIYLEINERSDITRIEMDSQFGSGDMYLRFKPEEESGKRTFRLESSDAGYTLKAFGLYNKMRGGSLLIYGQPQDGDLRGNLFGSAKIENFKVKGAPALAKLISVMSLQGVNNLLNNEGLVFKKLESDFEWRFSDDGNLLVMKNGRTSGSSLGLTFEGLVNQGSNTIDVSGTVIPLSGVNNVISEIPIIGNILTGGDALFAATYSMKGAAKDPKVSINPLSVLAPGFLRKILFEGDVDSKVKREEAKQ